jgi:hypothetical protein
MTPKPREKGIAGMKINGGSNHQLMSRRTSLGTDSPVQEKNRLLGLGD